MTLLAVALVAMGGSAWAQDEGGTENVIAIPTTDNAALDLKKSTLSASDREQSNTGSYLDNMFNTNTATFTLNNTVAQDYVLQFKASRQNEQDKTVTLNLKIGDEMEKDVTIAYDNTWTPTTVYRVNTGTLTTGEKSFVITFKSNVNNGTTCNVNDIKFIPASEYDQVSSSESTLTLEKAETSSLDNKKTSFESIYHGATATFWFYVSEATAPILTFEGANKNVAGGKMNVALYDVDGTELGYSKDFEITQTGDWSKYNFYFDQLPNLSTGLKMMKLTFTNTTGSSYVCNVKNFVMNNSKFITIPSNESAIDLSKATLNGGIRCNAATESKPAYFSHNQNGHTATFLLNNTTEQALRMMFKSGADDDGSTLTLSLKKGDGTEEWNKVYNLVNTGKTSTMIAQLVDLPTTTAGLKTLVITFGDTGGESNYVGDFSEMYLTDQQTAKAPFILMAESATNALPTATTSDIADNGYGVCNNCKFENSSQSIAYTKPGSTATYQIVNNAANYYIPTFDVCWYNNKTTNIAMSITNNGTEIYNKSVDVSSNNVSCTLPAVLLPASSALKVIFTFTSSAASSSDNLVNIKNINFAWKDKVAYTVANNEAGLGTFCCEFPLDFTGSGATAYIINDGITDGKITATKVEGVVPAGKGIIVKGTQNANVSVKVSTDEATTDFTNNKLVGVLKDTEITYDSANSYYVLSGGELHPVKSNGTIAANRAYLFLKDVSSASARSLSLVFGDEATGISASLNDNAEMTNGKVYDLQGRPVAQPTKGLYIVNGKKVVKR